MANKPVPLPEALLADLRPTNGMRFVLLRGAYSGDQAAYAGAIITPTTAWQFSTLLIAGAAEAPQLVPVTPADAPQAAPPEGAPAELAPAAAIDMLAMIARLTARAAPSRITSGLTPWPPRIVRWRGPGRGA